MIPLTRSLGWLESGIRGVRLKNKLVVFLGHFDVDVDIDVGVTVDFNFYDPIHFVVKFDIYVCCNAEASSCKSHFRVKKTVSPVFPLPYISQDRTENLNVATLFLHLCC